MTTSNLIAGAVLATGLWVVLGMAVYFDQPAPQPGEAWVSTSVARMAGRPERARNATRVELAAW